MLHGRAIGTCQLFQMPGCFHYQLWNEQGALKITKTGNCWELGLTKGLMEHAVRQVWKWNRVKECRKQCSVTSG